MTSSTLYIIRKDLSPYHNPGFLAQEKAALESIPGICYLGLESQIPALTPLGACIWLTNTHTQLPPLEQVLLRQVRLIIHANSGYDNFNPDWVKMAPFPIIIGNPIRAQAVVQYILACLLSHFNLPAWSSAWDTQRQWQRPLLSQKQVLIIGYGHIGKLLAQSLRPLVQQLNIYDPFQGYSKLPDLNQQHIVIPVPGLNSSNMHMLNEAFLNQLPSDFVLINAARGKLVDLEALKKILSSRPDSFAYLDVFPYEPYPLDELQSISNLRASSHIAGVYQDLDPTIIEFEKQVITDYLKHQQNPERFKSQYQDLFLQNRLHPDGFLI